MMEKPSYVDGRIQAQISMSAHRFLRDHSHPNEPLYKALDRIVGMYKVSEVGPIVEENRRLQICLKAAEEVNHELKMNIENLEKKLEYAKTVIREFETSIKNKTLTEFLH